MKFKMARIGNPWISDEYEIDGNLAQQIANELSEICESQRDNDRINASWDYNKYVHPLLEKHIKENSDLNSRALVRAIMIKLDEMSNIHDWSDGSNAARRVVQTYSAYSNPDFLKAKAYHDIHGS